MEGSTTAADRVDRYQETIRGSNLRCIAEFGFRLYLGTVFIQGCHLAAVVPSSGWMNTASD